MTKVLSIRLGIEEEAFMRRQMEIAGESNFSAHVKRVYFGTLNPGEGVLASVRRDQELTLSMLAKMARGEDRESKDKELGPEDRALELRLLAAIFLMLHMSINKDARLLIDRHIDRSAVENFLKAGGTA